MIKFMMSALIVFIFFYSISNISRIGELILVKGKIIFCFQDTILEVFCTLLELLNKRYLPLAEFQGLALQFSLIVFEIINENPLEA